MAGDVLIRQIQLGREHLLNIGSQRILALAKHFFFVSELNGCQICNARPYGQNGSVPLAERFHVLSNLRTRANQAHLTDQDIPELGQFVEFRYSKKLPNTRDSMVSGDCDQIPAAVRHHRAKFPNPEGAEVEANPFLREQNRQPTIEKNCQSNDEQDRRKYNQRHETDHDIAKSLRDHKQSKCNRKPLTGALC